MALNEHFRLQGLKVKEALIGGMSGQSVKLGIETRAEKTSGQSWAQFISVVSGKPTFDFTTKQIAKLLGEIGTLGKSIADLGAGVVMYAARFGQGDSSPMTGSVHLSYGLSKGILVPQTISVSDREDATISGQALGISPDGTTNPLAHGENIALPAGLLDDEVFGMGPVKIAGQTYSGKKSVTIEFGLTAEPDGTGGEIFDTQVGVMEVAPSITISGINLAWLGSAVGQVPLMGRTVEHVDTEIFLRKRLGKGTYEPDGNSVHPKFSMAGMATISDAASGDDKSTCEITIGGIHDGTQVPLFYTANQPIA